MDQFLSGHRPQMSCTDSPVGPVHPAEEVCEIDSHDLWYHALQRLRTAAEADHRPNNAPTEHRRDPR